MPKGTMPRFRKTITGLLVLVGLLLSGVQEPAAAALRHAGHHHDQPLVQTVDAARPGLATPSDHHDDHGLPCCLGCQCAMHVAVLPAAVTLPAHQAVAINYLPGSNRDRPGFDTMPAPPPPRRVA